MFTACSSFSIVNFEQKNTGWVVPFKRETANIVSTPPFLFPFSVGAIETTQNILRVKEDTNH